MKASEARRDLHCVSSSTFCAEPMFNLERGISGKHNKVHIIFAAVRRYCCRCSSEERIVFEKTNGLLKQLEKMSSRFETLRCCLDLCVDTNAHMSFSKVNRKMLFGTVEQKEPDTSDKESSRGSDCCATEEDQEEEANLSLKRWLRLKNISMDATVQV